MRRRMEEESRIEVLEQNESTLALWLKIGVYRHGAYGGILGLDWVAAKAILELYGVVPTPEQLDKMRIIEGGFVSEFNRK